MKKVRLEFGKVLFWRSLRTELHRGIFSSRFLFSVGLMLLWLFFSAAEASGSYEGAVFSGIPVLIRLAITGHFSTGPVLLAISTIPYAYSYLMESECGFQKQAVTRVGYQIYGTCKCVATFLSAFLMGAIALMMFIIISSAIGIPHTVRYDEVRYTYAAFVVTMGHGWYYASKLLHVGLVCGQAAVFSLMAMAWIPNSYVGFLSPLIGYYLYECILSLISRAITNPFLWRLVSANALLAGSAADNPAFNYIWTTSLLSIMALFFGTCFMIRIEKELTE